MNDIARLVMGFDFGTRKIGVAVGEQLLGTANGIAVLRAENGAPDWQQIEVLLTEWQPERLVVGLPINMDGSESDMSLQARRFARRLAGRFNLPVAIMDERLTSYEAGQTEEDPERDHIAAALILESWFRNSSSA